MPTLFDPLQLGSIELANRIAMAPLTRARAGREATPNKLMAAYYAQRASAGLIIPKRPESAAKASAGPMRRVSGTENRFRAGSW